MLICRAPLVRSSSLELNRAGDRSNKMRDLARANYEKKIDDPYSGILRSIQFPESKSVSPSSHGPRLVGWTAHLTSSHGPRRRIPRRRKATSALPCKLSRGLTERNRRMSPNCRPPSGSHLDPASGAPAPSVVAGDLLRLHAHPREGSLQNRRPPRASAGLHSAPGAEVSAETAGKRHPRGQLHGSFL